MYDTHAASWLHPPYNLSMARKKHAATTVGQTALFGGGYLSGHGSLSSVDLFHGPSGTWKTANLSSSRMRLEATSAMGKAYFVSGMGDECGSNCPAVDVYDDATSTWSVETLLSPRYEFTASAAPDGHGFVVVGGKQTKRYGAFHEPISLFLSSQCTLSLYPDLCADMRTIDLCAGIAIALEGRRGT